MKVVLNILIAQGMLGGFDVFWNHEWKERLPARFSAAREQQIHGVRELLYAFIFIGLAWYSWQGGWALVLAGLLALEILLTAWDFIVEDKTRILGPNERVLHLLLSMGGGAYVALLIPELLRWWTLPAALEPAYYGMPSWILTLFGAGVFVWGMRDAWSGVQLARLRRGCEHRAYVA
jgi:hypothetical protein